MAQDETKKTSVDEAEAAPALGSFRRTGEIASVRQDGDDGDSVFELSFSSEDPYRRYFGIEVLDHKRSSVDLEFLASGNAPVLLQHDANRQIGVIEKASIKNKRGVATVRLGNGPLAQEVAQDIRDGIRKNVSVAYQIRHMVREEVDEDSEVMRVDDWKPFEVSIVSVPADETVGVGREMTESQTRWLRGVCGEAAATDEPKEETMSDHDNRREGGDAASANPAPEDRAPAQTVDLDAVRAEAGKAERERVGVIMAIGENHGLQDEANEAIKTGVPADDFRAQALDLLGKRGERQVLRTSDSKIGDEDIGLSQKDVERYSLMRLIRAQAAPTDRAAQEAASFEFEVSSALAEKMQLTPKGAFVPDLVMQRDLVAGTPAAGGNLVDTALLSGSFIELLRKRTVVMQAGAFPMSGLVGDVDIPKQTAAATATWAAESGAATESNLTIGQVSMTPKRLTAHTNISGKLMKQSSMDVEALVRNDFARVFALEIDRAALYGTGSNNQPTGVHNTTGINTVSAFSTDNMPSWGEIVGLESAVAADDADIGTMAYLVNATMRGTLKTTEKATNTAVFIWDRDGMVNGYNAFTSNQVEAGDVIFGHFGSLVVGMWGGMDVVVDPYTSATSDTTRVIAHQYVDVALRYPEAFVIGT